MKTLRVLSVIGLLGLFLAMPAMSFAAVPEESIPEPAITDVQGVYDFVFQFVNIIFTLLLILAVVFILVAAYKYLTAGGDPDKVKSANQSLLFALVAVAVAVLARSFIAITRSLIGA
jgi:phosphoglycerol transferase MdoB-like AlkP superfamily enzyme